MSSANISRRNSQLQACTLSESASTSRLAATASAGGISEGPRRAVRQQCCTPDAIDDSGRFGPGMTFTDTRRTTASNSSSSSSGHGAGSILREENVRLQEEVAHLRSVLAGMQPGPPGADPSRLAWARLVAHSAQLQRQVATLSAELQASRAVMHEAEAALEETFQRMEQLGRSCAVGGEACPACGAGLQAFAERMLHRLRRQRADAAEALTRRQPTRCQGTGGWEEPGANQPPFPAPWDIPYTPAGGNRFLCSPQPPSSSGSSSAAGLTVAALGRRAPGLADPAQVLELQGLLCHLGPRLGGLSVLLTTTLLPALPWISLDVREQVEGELAGAAQDVSKAAAALVELGCATASHRGLLAQPAPLLRASRVLPFVSSGDGAGGGAAPGRSAALGQLHAAFSAAMEEARAGGAALPRERRAAFKAALSAAQQLANRWMEEAAGMAARSSVVEREVRWVEAAVSQQAEAVWQLLYADAMARPSKGQPAPGDRVQASLLVAAGVHRVREAAAALQAQPSEAALKDLVRCCGVHESDLAAAARQQERLAHVTSHFQAHLQAKPEPQQ